MVILDYPGGPSLTTWVPKKGEPFLARVRGGWIKGEASELYNIAGFEGAAGGPGAKEWGQHLEVKKVRDKDFP